MVIFSDGTPWFVAKDVCEGLALTATTSTSTHISRLKLEQRQTLRMRDVSNVSLRIALFPPKVSAFMLISRGGFNDLILESRKPVAREYRQWVTDTVLPALQDTGTFTDKEHPKYSTVKF